MANSTVYALQSGYEQVGWVSIIKEDVGRSQYSSPVCARVDGNGDVHLGMRLLVAFNSNTPSMHVVIDGTNGYVDSALGMVRQNYNFQAFQDNFVSGDYVYTVGHYSNPPQTVIHKTNLLGVLQATYNSSMSNRDVAFGKIAADSSDNFYLLSRGEYPNFNDWYFNLEKINSSGTQQWTRYTGVNSDNFMPGDVVVDSNGNVYGCGHSVNGFHRVYVFKYNSSGTQQWERQISLTNTYVSSQGIAVDSSGNVYVSLRIGNYSGVCKFSSSGSHTWTKVFQPQSCSNAYLALDDTNDVLYLVSDYHDSDGGTTYGAFIAQLDFSGNINWTRAFKTIGSSSRAIYPESADCDSTHLFVCFDNYLLSGVTSPVILKIPADGTGTGSYTDFKYISESVSNPSVTLSITTPTANAGTSITSISSPTAGSTSYNFSGNQYVLQIEVKEIAVTTGTFTYTGYDVTHAQEIDFDASTGSFLLTGIANSLSYGAKILATVASFNLTGNAATLTKQFKINLNAASFVAVGNTVTLLRNKKNAANTANFVLTGQAINLRKQLRLESSIGSFVFTGNTTSLAHKRLFNTQAGSFALTGNSTTIIKAFGIAAAVGEFTLTGNTAALEKTNLISGETVNFVFTGIAAGFAEIYIISPNIASFALSGGIATLKDAETLTASTGTFAFTAPSVEFAVASTLNVDAGSFTLSGNAATLQKFSLLAASVASYALFGQAANLLKKKNISPSAGSFILTANANLLQKQNLISSQVQSFVLSGLNVSLGKKRNLIVSNAVFVLNGLDVQLKDAEKLAAELSHYSFTGNNAVLVLFRLYNTGSFEVTGNTVALTKGLVLNTTRSRFRLKFPGKRQVVFVF